MNMINISTYIKANGVYVDFLDFNEEIYNTDYIEGFIELTVNGVKLIDNSMHDYIDDLWSYFSEGLASIYKGEDFKTYFPDQPIEVKFEKCRNNKHILLTVNCHEEISVEIGKKEFFRVMKLHAEMFFDKLKQIAPSSISICEYAKKYLNQIEV